MNRYVLFGLLFLCISLQVQAKIMRNNALMSKMISHFQQDMMVDQHIDGAAIGRDGEKPLPIKKEQNRNTLYPERARQREQQVPEPTLLQKTTNVFHVVQHVLCRNFPKIPCSLIMQDDEINKLIEQSILQISRKNANKMEMTTLPPTTKSTVSMPVDSEDLSNFLEVSHTGFFDETGQLKAQSKRATIKSVWMHEKPSKKKMKKMSKDTKRGTKVYNGKKMKKFYPHKVKYKDKSDTGRGGSYREYRSVRHSEDKVSMSAELPDMSPVGLVQKAAPMSFKLGQSDSPVWRIDYMKHGEPSLNNLFSFQGKVMSAGSHNQQAVEAHGTQHKAFYHKDVLHPDVYIKNNYIRKTQR